jgi:light-regulated signal transduction histidine kinase (bacteriophytochrome)
MSSPTPQQDCFGSDDSPWDALQEFSYIAIHDLRAPMRRVSILAGLLRTALGENPDPAVQSLIDQLVQTSAQGMRLVGQLQVLAEVMGPPVVAEQVECAVALRGAMQKLRTEIETSKAEIVIGELPVVTGQPALLQIVFENLLSNTLRFRSTEPLRVEINAVRAGDDWHISVSDSGLGIDAAGAEQLFRPFKRLHGSKQAGAGLGLAICRQVVERCGGRIWVGEPRGQGATIVLALRAA